MASADYFKYITETPFGLIPLTANIVSTIALEVTIISKSFIVFLMNSLYKALALGVVVLQSIKTVRVIITVTPLQVAMVQDLRIFELTAIVTLDTSKPIRLKVLHRNGSVFW